MRKITLIFFSLIVTAWCGNNGNNNIITPDNNTEPDVPAFKADNQKIVNIISEISEDSLRANILKLQGFYTRHTNSDTVSEVQGIGAARRWIHSKFSSCRERYPERISVINDVFVKSINDINRNHKNVIYRQEGSDYPNRIFIAGAHYDSRTVNRNDFESYAPGANDDGSGVAAVLEIARVLSGYTFKSTVILACFTGEEEGLHGSRHLAEKYKQSGYIIEGMLGLDMIGNIVGGSGIISDNTVRCFSQGPHDSAHRQLARYIKLQGEAYVENFTINLIQAIDRPGRGGDQIAFVENDYTAVRITEPEDNLEHQHNSYDTIEFMSIPYLVKNTGIIAAVLTNLADSPQMVTIDDVEELDESTVKINWDVQIQDNKGFIIGVREGETSFYDTLITTGPVNTYSILKTDSRLFVSLSAVDNDDNESLFSKEITINPK